jgi:hypothetical protein
LMEHLATTASPPRINNYLTKTYSSTRSINENHHPNSQRDSLGFSFGGGNSPSVNLRKPHSTSLGRAPTSNTSNPLAQTMPAKATMFQKLDFYGRNLKEGANYDSLPRTHGSLDSVPLHV